MLAAEEFMAFVQSHPRINLLLMRTLCERWRNADRRRIEFGMLDATSRVAQRLVELADRFGEPYPATEPSYGQAGANSVRITLALTQEELASWVGTSREAVNEALRTMRARGWIETGRRTVIVHDLSALRRRARV